VEVPSKFEIGLSFLGNNLEQGGKQYQISLLCTCESEMVVYFLLCCGGNADFIVWLARVDVQRKI
jgi:hypothetical protein